MAVEGVVQGVGFRPFVYGLASRLGLRGFVRNQAGSVRIEVEGEARRLDEFLGELTSRAPPLAVIERLSWTPETARGDAAFRIGDSEPAGGTGTGADPVFISADVATCGDCLSELFDPLDRRYLYPFLNCTHCGPRLTVVTGAPYDRERTTLAGFAMCPACRSEYHDPADRRFHAQPTACPVCGPRLELVDARGQRVDTADPVSTLVAAIRAGKIGAVKGLGGYHLACDARDPAAVAKLRRRKHRDEKPFAVMVAGADAAAALCEVLPAERHLLSSPRRPIVLLRKRTGPGAAIAEAVAPRSHILGVMLPYTPLHHLLLRAAGGIPMVMTSGNRSDEPVVYQDDQAIARLGRIADLLLVHNRPIHVRCDDSVTRVVDGLELPVRRSRGYAPQPLTLPVACAAPTLAVGGQLKGTFALGRDRHAFLSHHMGDLDHLEAFRAFERDVRLYQDLFEIRPVHIAHDLHPDYASTRYALRRAAEEGLELVAVQHHHAHMAACMAENALDEPVIGVTFDGTGFGTDGAVWGGEFLVGDYRGFRRAAHLRYVGMPGGEQAIREPWRMAVAHLADAGRDDGPLADRLPPAARRTVRRMLERRFNTPLTSSAGRLFDAVASLAGVRDRASYEGQAAVDLEALATGVSPCGTYPFEIAEATEEAGRPEAVLVVDTRSLTRAVADDAGKPLRSALIARRFHSTLVELIVAVCRRLRATTGVDAVVLSGGVFMNALVTSETCRRLSRDGLRVYRHRLVPPNDGGLSLGQLAVAARCSSPAGRRETGGRF